MEAGLTDGVPKADAASARRMAHAALRSAAVYRLPTADPAAALLGGHTCTRRPAVGTHGAR